MNTFHIATLIIVLFMVFLVVDSVRGAEAFQDDFFVPCVKQYDTETFLSCQRISTWGEDGSLTVCRWYTFKEIVKDTRTVKVVCTVTGENKS